MTVAPGMLTIPISIHASRGGSDGTDDDANLTALIFQSTLPAGEATAKELNRYFGEVISIHASRGGSDSAYFLQKVAWKISIHASRGGSDASRAKSTADKNNFNPRFPRGKRPQSSPR